ncbi:methyltransferase family protein [Chloroflexota bacterium]
MLIKGLFGGLFQVALLGALLLVPAGLVPGGTWFWERALIFLGVYGGVLMVTIVAFAVKAPASLEARLAMPGGGDQSRAGRMASAFLISGFAAWMIFIPVDVFYLKLLPPPQLGVSVAGLVLLLIGFAIIAAAIYQNRFIVPYVADQTDRGQTLVDTGPYGVVRHPLYAGMLPYVAGMALWLESYAGLIVVFVPLVALVATILVEEKTLRDALPGYTDYMKRVRYRLVPFIW